MASARAKITDLIAKNLGEPKGITGYLVLVSN